MAVEFDRSKLSKKAAAALREHMDNIVAPAPDMPDPDPETWLQNAFGRHVHMAANFMTGRGGLSAEEARARMLGSARWREAAMIRLVPGWGEFVDAMVNQAVDAVCAARQRAFALVERQQAEEQAAAEAEKAHKASSLMAKLTGVA